MSFPPVDTLIRNIKVQNYTYIDFVKDPAKPDSYPGGMEVMASYSTQKYCSLTSSNPNVHVHNETVTAPTYTPPCPAFTTVTLNAYDAPLPALTVSNVENCLIKCWDFDDIPYPEGTPANTMVCKYADPCCATEWHTTQLFKDSQSTQPDMDPPYTDTVSAALTGLPTLPTKGILSPTLLQAAAAPSKSPSSA